MEVAGSNANFTSITIVIALSLVDLLFEVEKAFESLST